MSPRCWSGVLSGFWNSYDYWAGPAYCRTVKTKQLFSSWLWWDITLEFGKLPAAFVEKSWHPNICINAACMFCFFFFCLKDIILSILLKMANSYVEASWLHRFASWEVLSLFVTACVSVWNVWWGPEQLWFQSSRLMYKTWRGNMWSDIHNMV